MQTGVVFEHLLTALNHQFRREEVPSLGHHMYGCLNVALFNLQTFHLIWDNLFKVFCI